MSGAIQGQIWTPKKNVNHNIYLKLHWLVGTLDLKIEMRITSVHILDD